MLSNNTILSTGGSASSSSRCHKPVASCETRWGYRSRQVTAIKKHVPAYISCFQTMVESQDGRWKESVLAASGFLNTIEGFDFCFWLETFEQIFAQTDILYGALQSLKMDIGWAGPSVEKCMAALRNLRGSAGALYDRVCEVADPPSTNRRKRKRNTIYDCFSGAVGGEAILTHKEEKCRVFIEVIDKVLRCLNDRFGDIGQYKFIKLLDVTKFTEFRVKFPDVIFQSLKNSVYAQSFDLVTLRSNLITIYKRDDIPSHLDQIVKMTYEQGMVGTVSQFCRLAELCLTVPVTVVSGERSFSGLRRIKDRLRSIMGDMRLSDLAVMSMSADIMETLDVQLVIDAFAAMKKRKLPLIYKK